MKLRKIYTSAGILLLSLFCIGDAVAKDAKFETGVSFGSTGADEPYSSLTDKDGNYYISGTCRGDVEFAGGATIKGRGGMDAVIVKYDAELNFLWARAVGGSKDDTFERIAVTSAGDIVAVGKISGDVTIDGTDQTLSGTQSTDGCIVVYDKDGNYKSSAQIKAAGASLCYSVAVDKSDNIFVTGSTVGATDFGNEKTVTIEESNPGTFLACYNNSLVCQWAIAGSSPVQSYGWAVNFDKEENILLTGRFGTTFTITGTDGEALTTAVGSESSQDTYVAKLSHEGVGQWITYVTNSNRIDTRSIDSDSQGNVYIWGHCQSAVTPEGQSPLGFNGNFDSFLIKYSSAGAYLDGMNLGGSGRDEAKSLFVDADDNIYVAGNVNGDGSKGGTAVNMNPRGESKDYTFKGHDGYVAKYNGSTWELMQLEKTVTPDNANQHEVAWCVTMSPDYNKVYVTGYFNNGATVFDGASLTLPFVRDYDIYTVLYSYTLMVKTKTLEPGVANEPYYSNIVVDNVEGTVKFEIVSGTLPDGITLSEDGAFAGTPTKNGSYTFIVKISDDVSSIQKEYTLVIKSGEGCDVFIVTDQCPDAYIGYPYSLQLEIEGEGITCALTGGSLPVGLSLSPEGLISGTPAESNEPGIYSFTVKATGASGCDDELELSMILSDETPSGINRVSLDSFQVYPTVSYGEITLKADFGKDMKARVAVVTPLGTCVWEKTYYGVQLDEVISTADMQPGVYYLVLSTEEGKSTKPFIVKR